MRRCENILNPCASEFQSDILTLQTSTPDLTDCFHNTVLVWIPCGFFWISMIYWIPFLRQQERRSHWGQSSVLNLVKSVRANIFPPYPDIDDANLKGTLWALKVQVHHGFSVLLKLMSSYKALSGYEVKHFIPEY